MERGRELIGDGDVMARPTTAMPLGAVRAGPAAGAFAALEERLTRTVVGLLWAAFVNDVAVALLAPGSPTDAVTLEYRFANALSWLWPIALLLIVAQWRRELEWRARAAAPGVRMVIGFALMTVLAAGYGAVTARWDDATSVVRTDTFPYLAAPLALLGAAFPQLGDRLARNVGWQVGIAAVAGTWIVVTQPIVGRADFATPHYRAYFLLLPVAFAAGYLSRVGLARKIAAVAAVLAVIAISLYGQNRLATAIFMGLVPVGAVLALIARRKNRKRNVALLAIAGVATGVVVASNINTKPLEDAWAATLGRTFETDTLRDASASALERTLTVEYEQSRGAEAEDFLSAATFDVWVIGAGAGGTWRSTMWGVDWPMVHFGPFNLVLRGGVVYALLFVMLHLLAMIRCWRRRRNPVAVSALLFFMVWFLGFLSHGPLPFGYCTWLAWLLLGAALRMSDAGGPAADEADLRALATPRRA